MPKGDDPIGFGGETAYVLAVMNRFNVSQDRGNVAGTRRQRFLFTGNYELPFGQGRRWASSSHLVNGALGGWNLNTITLLETGPYLTPTISPQFDQTNTDPELDGAIVRPDIVGNPIPAHRSASNYFKPQRIRAYARRCGAYRKCGRRQFGSSRNHRSKCRAGEGDGDPREYALALSKRRLPRAQPYELCAAGDQREQPQHVRSVAICANCGECRKSYRTAGTPVGLLITDRRKQWDRRVYWRRSQRWNVEISDYETELSAQEASMLRRTNIIRAIVVIAVLVATLGDTRNRGRTKGSSSEAAG